MVVTLNEVSAKCPAFGKGVCPYAVLVFNCEGLVAKCPVFKEGCTFKKSTIVGKFVERITQMQDT